jgi:ABC-type glycerol-3-phosphate transport system substrate-binding protein
LIALPPLTNKALMIWGTLPREAVTDVISEFAQTNQMTLNYQEKSVESIDREISEAIAAQQGPDIVLAPHELIIKHESKFAHIPYTTFPDRSYRDLYVDESRLFLYPDGILAFPMLVDPMIFYFNRVSYNNVALLDAPKTWQEVSNNVLKLNRKNGTEIILESGLPLGVFSNIRHAKDIIALLLIQAGNPIVSTPMDSNNTTMESSSTLADPLAGTNTPALQYVIQFFTQFADPLTNSYSWNRAMPEAIDAFASEQAAQYIGFGSEIPQIAQINPNINFDVGTMPQAEGLRSKKTFGRMYGLAVVKASKEQFAAFQTVLLMKDSDFSLKLLNGTQALYPIAPVRKDLLATVPPTKWGPIVYGSAIIATGWLDVNYVDTNSIFENLITQVTRNSTDITNAIEEANALMNDLLH